MAFIMRIITEHAMLYKLHKFYNFKAFIKKKNIKISNGFCKITTFLHSIQNKKK